MTEKENIIADHEQASPENNEEQKFQENQEIITEKDKAASSQVSDEGAVNDDTIDEKNTLQEEDIEKIKLDLAEKEKQCEEYFDRLQRIMAEFDNYKKRTAKEKQSLYDEAVGDTVLEFLPVMDNLERAIVSCKQEQVDAEKLLEGVEMILKQFKDCLKRLGVEEISAVGEVFDHNVHNAVMHVEDETVGEKIIVEEFQKGYKLKDKVIRYSMVKVAN